jgi:hypothetical protein
MWAATDGRGHPYPSQPPCRSRGGGHCNYVPSYVAWVYSKRDGKKIPQTFSDLAEAKGWRSDADSAVDGAGAASSQRQPEQDRFAEGSPQLIDALPAEDQALRATAMYAGLRRGELMARWEVVTSPGA